MMNDAQEFAFSADTKEAWKSRVERELKGKSFEDFLIWNSLDGFNIQSYQNKPPTPLPQPPLRSKPWIILEKIDEQDAQSANMAALNALNEGAESIWFSKSFLGAASEVVSNGIDQSIAPIFIKESTIADPYQALLLEGGEVMIDERPILVDGKRYRERGANPITEGALLLAAGIDLIERGVALEQFTFRTVAGSAFLTEIAKVRAFRWLWTSVVQQKGLKPDAPKMIGSNLTHHYAINDEHTNILRASSSAMANVLGGVDFLMLEPWNSNWKASDAFSQRITRNIQNLMKEEGRMDKSLNPVDGSYFLEHLTLNLAELMWKKTQSILQAGGFESAVRSGSIHRLISDERSALVDAYQQQERTLLGVNQFPPTDTKPEPLPERRSYAFLPEYCHIPTELNA